MPNQRYISIVVSGGGSAGDDPSEDEFLQAHSLAKQLFSEHAAERVSTVTPEGHNGLRSFCVFPSGSGLGREPELEHKAAMQQFIEYLKTTALTFTATSADDGTCEVFIIASSFEVVQLKNESLAG